MAKHIIFLVHGMGLQADTWSQPVQNLLKNLYNDFPGLCMTPFEDAFEFVPICYDDIFENIRKRWKSETDSLLAGMKNQGLDNKSADLLRNSAEKPTENEFMWTHVMDVVFYRFIATVRDAVRVRVAEQILKALGGTKPSSVLRWSVIAHSLGTAVAHDTIDALYRTTIPNKPDLHLSPSDTRAQVIMMVANVTRVLQTDVKVYESYIRPTIKPDPTRACLYYLTTRHGLDAFTIPKKFEPDTTWPDSTTRLAGRYQLMVVHHILSKNIHDFEHYLKNPEVHIPLFRALTAPYVISDEEVRSHNEEFQKSVDKELTIEVRQALEKNLPSESADWLELIMSLSNYGAFIKK